MGFCTKCGNRIDESVRFCSKCGQKVADQAALTRETNTNVPQAAAFITETTVPFAPSAEPIAETNIPIAEMYNNNKNQTVPFAENAVPFTPSAEPISEMDTALPVSETSVPIEEVTALTENDTVTSEANVLYEEAEKAPDLGASQTDDIQNTEFSETEENIVQQPEAVFTPYAPPAAPVYQDIPSTNPTPAFSEPPYNQAAAVYTPHTEAICTVSEEKPAKGSKFTVIGAGAWFGYMLLFGIPLIGFIFCIAWACGATKYENKRNFARGYLLFVLVILLLVFTSIALLIFVLQPMIGSIQAFLDSIFGIGNFDITGFLNMFKL